MYSNNDWRYYLEHQLEQSDDYLAHYGVKNMKWGKRKRKKELIGTVGLGADVASGVRSAVDNAKAHAEAKRRADAIRGMRTRTTMPEAKQNTYKLSTTFKDGRVYSSESNTTKTVNTRNLTPKGRKSLKRKIENYKKKKKFSNPLAPKNQKVEVISFKDQKTGKDWKK